MAKVRSEKIWVQLRKKLEDEEVEDEDFKFFFVYESEKELEEALKKYFTVWAEYPKEDPGRTFSLKRNGQRKYEVYVGGHLYYHDVKFKKYHEVNGYTGDIENNQPVTLKKWDNWREFIAKPENAKYLDNGLDHFEHYIYFRWLPENKRKKNQVIIYINETPPAYNSNPPKPSGPPPPEP